MVQPQCSQALGSGCSLLPRAPTTCNVYVKDLSTEKRGKLNAIS